MSETTMKVVQRHPYHLVDPSPWPLFASTGALSMTFGGVMWFHSYTGGGFFTITGMLFVFFCMFTWWRDIVREATFEGQHTEMVQLGMRQGMILFIASEVMFFFAFFWAFFHAAASPVLELGYMWPPQGIECFSAWEIPLLNTVILLTSGATCTWAHHAIVAGDRRSAILGLIFTLVLAVLFGLVLSPDLSASSASLPVPSLSRPCAMEERGGVGRTNRCCAASAAAPALLQRDKPRSRAPKSTPNGWDENRSRAAVLECSRRADFRQGRNRPRAAKAETTTSLSPARWQTVRHRLAFDRREIVGMTSLSSLVLAPAAHPQQPCRWHRGCANSVLFRDARVRRQADGYWLASCL